MPTISKKKCTGMWALKGLFRGNQGDILALLLHELQVVGNSAVIAESALIAFGLTVGNLNKSSHHLESYKSEHASNLSFWMTFQVPSAVWTWETRGMLGEFGAYKAPSFICVCRSQSTARVRNKTSTSTKKTETKSTKQGRGGRVTKKTMTTR